MSESMSARGAVLRFVGVAVVRIEDANVREMRPTAKLVYVTIRDADEPLAQHEIADRTNLNQRGVRDVLGELVDRGLVDAEHNFADLREMHYTIAEG